MYAYSQIFIVVILYLVFLIIWGIYHGIKVKNSSDYSIAGRELPGWIAALSERATGESAWVLLALPGAAYATGLVEIWTALGCVVGVTTAWVFIAWRLRNEGEKYRVTTFTEFIAKKHRNHGKWIRLVGSFTIVFFFFFYVSAQFLGVGKALFTLFNLNPSIGMAITGVVIISYTVYGGFRSVVYTNVIQAILMIVTLIVGPIAGFMYLANHPEVFAQTIPQAIEKAGSSYGSLTNGASGFAAGLMIISAFSWFFGYLGGQPQLNMRFLAIRNTKQAKIARNIGIVWTIIAYTGALLIGWIGLAIFGPTGLDNQELVMPSVMLTIFPPIIAAILITGAIAAIISTTDSLLIISASELSENLLKPALNWTEQNALKYSRLVTALLALVAMGLAYISPSNLIYNIVSYVWAGIGGTFAIVTLFTLFCKKFHGKAAVYTIIIGMVFTIVWISTGLDKWITARIMTFAVAGITALMASYLLPDN